MSKGLHKDPMEKFIDSIDILNNGCWQWRNSLASLGYGKFWIGKSQFLAHRFSYELYVGPIPNGLHIDHLCRNRGCVNPDHLEPVTIKENVLRGVGLAAKAARSTTCPAGHMYDAINNRGNRICKMCISISAKKYRKEANVKTR